MEFDSGCFAGDAPQCRHEKRSRRMTLKRSRNDACRGVERIDPPAFDPFEAFPFGSSAFANATKAESAWRQVRNLRSYVEALTREGACSASSRRG
jgi:hypothetical protein